MRDKKSRKFFSRGSRKKNLFFSDPATKRGGGRLARPIRRGGGGKALVAGPPKKSLFLRLPLAHKKLFSNSIGVYLELCNTRNQLCVQFSSV